MEVIKIADKNIEFEKSLLEKGYKKYDEKYLDHECSRCFFQKKFADEKGVKYYIEVVKWDFSEYTVNIDIQYDYHVQLYSGENKDALNLEFFSTWDFDKVEKIVEEFFKWGNFAYYERWDKNE